MAFSPIMRGADRLELPMSVECRVPTRLRRGESLAHDIYRGMSQRMTWIRWRSQNDVSWTGLDGCLSDCRRSMSFADDE
jgi:hypothetical protein